MCVAYILALDFRGCAPKFYRVPFEAPKELSPNDKWINLYGAGPGWIYVGQPEDGGHPADYEDVRVTIHAMHTSIHAYLHTYVRPYKYNTIQYHTIPYIPYMQNYVTWHYTTLRYVSLHYITSHYIALHCIALMHTYIHTYMHACMHAYIYTCIHTYIHIYIHIYIYLYLYLCIQLYISTCVCVCLSLCLNLMGCGYDSRTVVIEMTWFAVFPTWRITQLGRNHF